MPTSIESIKTLLSGDKDSISIDTVIQACEDALKLGEPNILGESWYLHDGKPIEQTPLIMALEKLGKYGNSAEQNSKLEDLIKKLLTAGADIFTRSNFGGGSIAREWISPLTSCFYLIIQKPELLQYVPSKIIQDFIIIALYDLNRLLIWKSALIDAHIHLLARVSNIPDCEETRDYLFNLLLLKKESLLKEDKAAQEKLSCLVRHVTDKLPKDSQCKNIFIWCWENNSLKPWIRFFPESINWKKFSNLLNQQKLPSKEYNAYFSELIKRNLVHKLFKLEKFDVAGHNTSETWQDTIKGMILSKPTRTFPSKHQDKPISGIPKATDKADNIHKKIEEGNLRFKMFLGRTLLFEDSTTKDIIALKVQKKTEAVSELEKEAATLVAFHAKEGLSSKLPHPVSVETRLSQDVLRLIPAESASLSEMVQFKQMIADTPSLGVYYYEVKAEDSGYFTYLHDPALSDEVFQLACRRSIHDLTKLLKEDALVFHQLADIFHNSSSNKSRTDHGRYLVLSPMIRRFYEVRESGRVDKWKEAVEFVNLRATGLADVGDSDLFVNYRRSDIFQEITRPFQDRLASYPASEHADEFIYANLLAEYLFIFTLVCGRRAVEILQKHPEIDSMGLWCRTADQLISNAAQLLSELTGISETNARVNIDKCIQVDILAKQMAYWMTSSYAGKTPTREEFASLYPGASFENDRKEFIDARTKLGITGLGFSHDGVHQDLGGYNQQNPMKEDNKMYYFVSSLVRLFTDMGSQYREASIDFEQAIQEKHFDIANDALKKLEQNTYSHSKWQHMNNLRKKILLSRLIKEEQIKQEVEPSLQIQIPQDQPIDPLSKIDTGEDNYSETSDLTKIITAVQVAQKNYERWYSGDSIRGVNGFFSWLRHGTYGQNLAEKFSQRISEKSDKQEVISEINSLLTNKATRYHRHSFASFLLDELKGIENSPWHEISVDSLSNLYDKDRIKDSLNWHPSVN